MAKTRNKNKTMEIERCRLCLTTEKQKFIKITDDSLTNKLKNLLHLQILPKHNLICEKCLKMMKSFDEFYNICHHSEAKLMEEDRNEKFLIKEQQIKKEVTADPQKSTKKPTKTLKRINNQAKMTNPKKKCTTSKKISNAGAPVQLIVLHPSDIPSSNNNNNNNITNKPSITEPLLPQKPKITERCAHCFATFETLYELKLHSKIHVYNIVGGMKEKFQELFNKGETLKL